MEAGPNTTGIKCPAVSYLRSCYYHILTKAITGKCCVPHLYFSMLRMATCVLVTAAGW